MPPTQTQQKQKNGGVGSTRGTPQGVALGGFEPAPGAKSLAAPESLEQLFEGILLEGHLPDALIEPLAGILTNRQTRALLAAVGMKTPPAIEQRARDEAVAAGDAPREATDDDLREIAETLTEEQMIKLIEMRGNAAENAHWRSKGVRASTHYVVVGSFRCTYKGQVGAQVHSHDDKGLPVAIEKSDIPVLEAQNALQMGLIRIPGQLAERPGAPVLSPSVPVHPQPR